MRRRARGFTMLEILAAVIVTAVGFAAIFSLQIGTMEGNISAREMGAAVSLGERSIERLRSQAYMWTAAGIPPVVNNADIDLTKADGQWHSLTTAPVDQNFLPRGANGSGLERQRFCVRYLLQPLDGTYEGILNTRVRVIWPRAALDNGGLAEACLEANAQAAVPVDRFYTITIPATIRRHPAGV